MSKEGGNSKSGNQDVPNGDSRLMVHLPVVRTYSIGGPPSRPPQQTSSAGEMFIMQQRQLEAEQERQRQQRQQRLQEQLQQLQQSERSNRISLDEPISREVQQASQHVQPATHRALELNLSNKRPKQPSEPTPKPSEPTPQPAKSTPKSARRTSQQKPAPRQSRVNSDGSPKRARPKKTYSGLKARRGANKLMSRPDPFEELPADLSISFSKWFYDDLRHFKPRSRDQNQNQNQTDPRSTVERYLERQINEQIDPHRFKFLTQDLLSNSYCDEITPVSKFTRYNILLEEQLFDDSGKSSQGSPKSSHSGVSNSNGSSKQFLTLESQTVILDRRPMIKKLENLKQISTSLRSSNNNAKHDSLIQPNEDCDDSCGELEYVEINCDSETVTNMEQVIS